MYLANLSDPEWPAHLAYLVAIFTHLKIINKSLQGGWCHCDLVDKLKFSSET